MDERIALKTAPVRAWHDTIKVRMKIILVNPDENVNRAIKWRVIGRDFITTKDLPFTVE